MLKRYLPLSRPSALIGLCLAGAWLPSVAHAQPGPPAQPPGPDDGTAWDALKKQMAGAEPQAAIDAYQKFWNSHPNIDPNIGINITMAITDLYGNKLHKPDEVLKIDDWAIQQYQKAPAAVWLLEHKVRMLNDAKRYAEAVKVPETNWPAMVRGGQYREGWVVMYAATTLRRADEAYVALGTPEKDLPLLTKSLTEMPALLQESAQGQGGWQNGWIYEALATRSLDAKQPDAALGWAKLNFMECAFDKDALDRATRLLGKLWATSEEFSAIHNFAAAQTDPAAKNPLAAVKLPVLDAAALQAQVERLRGKGKVLDRPQTLDLISVLIEQGRLGEAMTQAKRLLIDNPTAPEGAQQVCRVFKAADLNTIRANAFVAYLGGQGPNPLPAFFKEHETEAAPAPPQAG